MEATPSLACANKCVFCWRHHTNPVGKSWQWKMDDPIEIVNTAIDLHTNMIKQMKGVPGTFIFFSYCMTILIYRDSLQFINVHTVMMKQQMWLLIAAQFICHFPLHEMLSTMENLRSHLLFLHFFYYDHFGIWCWLHSALYMHVLYGSNMSSHTSPDDLCKHTNAQNWALAISRTDYSDVNSLADGFSVYVTWCYLFQDYFLEKVILVQLNTGKFSR